MVEVLAMIVEYFDGLLRGYTLAQTAFMIWFCIMIIGGFICLIKDDFFTPLSWVVVGVGSALFIFLSSTHFQYQYMEVALEEAVVYGSIIGGVVLFLAVCVVWVTIEAGK